MYIIEDYPVINYQQDFIGELIFHASKLLRTNGLRIVFVDSIEPAPVNPSFTGWTEYLRCYHHYGSLSLIELSRATMGDLHSVESSRLVMLQIYNAHMVQFMGIDFNA